jgi:hypothetical protein
MGEKKRAHKTEEHYIIQILSTSYHEPLQKAFRFFLPSSSTFSSANAAASSQFFFVYFREGKTKNIKNSLGLFFLFFFVVY